MITARTVFLQMLAWLAGFIVVPIALALHHAGRGYPAWAWYWANDDGGLGGELDSSYVRKHLDGDAKKAKRFWRQLYWLQLRNPVHNLAHHKLGIQPGAHANVVTEGPDVLKRGVFGYRRMTVSSRRHGQYVRLHMARFSLFGMEVLLKYGPRLWYLNKQPPRPAAFTIGF